MLSTNLKHIEDKQQLEILLKDNKNVMICCGRMGPMCLPVYGIMNNIEKKYPSIQFRDIDFDTPIADFIKSLPECSTFMGLPFTVYFKEGKVVKATSSIQEEKQIMEILNKFFKE